MIRFIYRGKNTKIIMAIKRIEEKLYLLNEGKLSDQTIKHLAQMTFDERYTEPRNLKASDIVHMMLQRDFAVEINEFTQSWLTWKMYQINAFTTPQSRAITFNTRGLNRTNDEIEETLWHELIHILDFVVSDCQFHHGSNDPRDKDSCAPILLSKYLTLKKVVSEGESWTLV